MCMSLRNVRVKKLAEENPVWAAIVAIGSCVVVSSSAAARTRTSLTNSIGV